MKTFFNQVEFLEREQYFLECIKDLIAKNTKNVIFYYKPNDDKAWFEVWKTHETKRYHVICSYNNVWSIFENKFKMKTIIIQEFIKDMILKHTDWVQIKSKEMLVVSPMFNEIKNI